MANISNRDILNLLEERDQYSCYHKGEISNNFEKKNIGKFYEIQRLIHLLMNDNYCLTEKDVELLKEYNIFTVRESKSRKKNSFVAISDFHGYSYPIDKVVQYYLEEYDYIYILGDATDRGPYKDGTGSVELLCVIKQLTELYPGRVIYIPGNHDSFIVGHDKGDVVSTLTMERNNGSKTIDELERLKLSDPWAYRDLIEWLGSLPLQRMHEYDGKYYALAHAFFDKNLYDRRPCYDLKSHFSKGNNDFSAGNRVLWFRKKDMYKAVDNIADEKVQQAERNYVKNACPTSDVTVVIGHSRSDVGSREHDLKDKYGNTVTVHCVDGGIAYNGIMLKYDGGGHTNQTCYLKHNNISVQENNVNSSFEAAKSCLKNYVVTSMYTFRKEAFDREKYLMPITITNEEFADIVDSYEGRCGFSYDSGDYQDRYCLYRKIVAFDLIIQNLFDKYHDEEKVISVLNGFFFGQNGTPSCNPEWFTRDRDTRYFAEVLGRDNMIDVLVAYNCKSVVQYIRLKSMVDEKGKIKIKI